ncbi:MAG TPA: thioesterase family protein [Mucilaginibacter sp.]
MQKSLKHATEISIKFSEVDSLGIVWHGHYVRYFEDGREAFGKEFGLEYLTVYNNHYVTPIVSMDLKYKQVLRYGDKVIIETEYIPDEAARITFNYRLLNATTGEVVVTGTTVQVFLHRDSFMLQLTNPEFFEAWKQKHALI